MKVAVFIVARTSFDINKRLPLLRTCLELARGHKVDVAIFPGGFFRITAADESALDNELNETGKQFSTLPFLTGVDFLSEGTKKPVTQIKQKFYENKKTNNGLGPWIWVVSSTGIAKIYECWRKDGCHRRPDASRATQLNNFSVLPLVCGDVFVPDITFTESPVSLVCVSAHWSLQPACWAPTLRSISRRKKAPVVLAQHLVIPPGHNYAYDQDGQKVSPQNERAVDTDRLPNAFCRIYNFD